MFGSPCTCHRDALQDSFGRETSRAPLSPATTLVAAFPIFRFAIRAKSRACDRFPRRISDARIPPWQPFGRTSLVDVHAELIAFSLPYQPDKPSLTNVGRRFGEPRTLVVQLRGATRLGISSRFEHFLVCFSTKEKERKFPITWYWLPF